MIGRVISTIWSIVLLIALVIWYSIGGWTAVLKAVLAMGGFGLCIAGVLKMRHDRKQCAVVAIPTGPLPSPGYVYEEPNEAQQGLFDVLREMRGWDEDVRYAHGEVYEGDGRA